MLGGQTRGKVKEHEEKKEKLSLDQMRRGRTVRMYRIKVWLHQLSVMLELQICKGKSESFNSRMYRIIGIDRLFLMKRIQVKYQGAGV